MGLILLLALIGAVAAGCLYAFSNYDTNPGNIGSKLTIRRSLEASVIRACTKCGAAGVDDFNKYVGEVCPACGADRPPIENKGEIWSQTI